jgi:hypothetical protein
MHPYLLRLQPNMSTGSGENDLPTSGNIREHPRAIEREREERVKAGIVLERERETGQALCRERGQALWRERERERERERAGVVLDR